MCPCYVLNCSESRNESAVCVQTKMVHRSPQGQASLVSMQRCCVCFTEFSSLSSNVKLPCGHNQACSNCWRQFILAKLEDGHASHLQCMSVGCHMPVPLSEARKVLTDERYDLGCLSSSCLHSVQFLGWK